MVAGEAAVLGLVCLGYPFHPPGKPERTRTKHLENLKTPTLIPQGTRDSFCRPEDAAGLQPKLSIDGLGFLRPPTRFSPLEKSQAARDVT